METELPLKQSLLLGSLGMSLYDLSDDVLTPPIDRTQYNIFLDLPMKIDNNCSKKSKLLYIFIWHVKCERLSNRNR